MKSGSTLIYVTPPQFVGLSMPGGTWTATVDQPWLSVSPATGSGPTILSVQIASATNLPTTGPGPTATITLSAPAATNSPQQITVDVMVYLPGTTVNPFGFMDTPANNATGLHGAVPVTGWSLDDIGVPSVKVYRDPVAGDPPPGSNGKIFVGDATFVAGERPDVEALFPTYPVNYRGGWGYMLLTNMLPDLNLNQPVGGNGTFTFYAYATDVEGHTVLLGSRTFTCSNSTATQPFGTIDTPASGAFVIGNLDNFGWVLTPQPDFMLTDGSGIQLFIDGNLVPSSAVYNMPRSDIATLFPGYANTSGPVGYFSYDTTQLANGLHTIFWIATDNNGHADGLGSRFFWVLN